MSRRKLVFIGSFDSELTVDLYNPSFRDTLTINIKKQRSSSDFHLELDDARRFAEEVLRQCDILEKYLKEKS